MIVDKFTPPITLPHKENPEAERCVLCGNQVWHHADSDVCRDCDVAISLIEISKSLKNIQKVLDTHLDHICSELYHLR
jgi:hypothetical protein